MTEVVRETPAAVEGGLRIEPRWLTSRRQTHWTFLVMSLLVIVMSFLLEVRPNGRVHFRFAPDHVLPHTCASKILFNRNCAGCGLTRSFIHLAALRVQESWNIHRAGFLMAILVLAQVPYRVLRLRQLKEGVIPEARWTRWISWFVIAGIILHWVLAQFGI